MKGGQSKIKVGKVRAAVCIIMRFVKAIPELSSGFRLAAFWPPVRAAVTELDSSDPICSVWPGLAFSICTQPQYGYKLASTPFTSS